MSFGPAVQKFDGVPVTAEEELRMTRRVACFAIGEDVLLIWDDVFDARQKRHESGICEHGRLHQAGSPSVAVRKVLEAGVIQVDICGSFEGVLDFLRLLEQHVKRTTAPARHGLGFLSNDDRQPMGDRFVKVAKKGNEEDAIREPPATDLNKGLMDIIEHQRFVQRHCPGRASELEEIDRIAQLEGVAVDSGGCKRKPDDRILKGSRVLQQTFERVLFGQCGEGCPFHVRKNRSVLERGYAVSFSGISSYPDKDFTGAPISQKKPEEPKKSNPCWRGAVAPHDLTTTTSRHPLTSQPDVRALTMTLSRNPFLQRRSSMSDSKSNLVKLDVLTQPVPF